MIANDSLHKRPNDTEVNMQLCFILCIKHIFVGRNSFLVIHKLFLLQIWDHSLGKLLHSVPTIASVARIKWRPERKYHIASCSLVIDFSINVWDVRRPYIPFASFEEHKNVATGKQLSLRHQFLSINMVHIVIQKEST